MSNMEELILMRSFFLSKATYPVKFRLEQLQNLKTTIKKKESQIYQALKSDLGKSPEESWVTENGFLLTEINHAIKNLSAWVSAQPVPTNLLNFPGKSFILPEPLGVVFIIGPWNYPLQLVLAPLVAAIAAGNCVVIKPSEFAPETEKLIQSVIAETFPANYINVATGEGAVVVPEMMNNFRFDHVFYTGSTTVGKLIYQMAAKQLVPVTLELGGKSPVIVDEDANITVSAKRIAMAKFSNAGQMCIAPDYVLVHKNIAGKFLEELKKTIIHFFGNDASCSYDYGKIISQKHFNHLVSCLQNEQIYYGGNYNINNLYIEPTIIYPAQISGTAMMEEIFGPIIPVVEFGTSNEALEIISRHSNPLAAYIFSASKARQQFWLNQIQSGGACINTASVHFTNPELPFGGRGNSGIGRYHGRFGFETFSHLKSVLNMPVWPDPSLRYPPYKGKLSWFKKIIGR